MAQLLTVTPDVLVFFPPFSPPVSTQTAHLIKISMINRSEIAVENMQSHGRSAVSYV